VAGAIVTGGHVHQLHTLGGGPTGRLLALDDQLLTDLLVVTAYTLQRSHPGSELQTAARRLRAAITSQPPHDGGDRMR